MLIPLALTTLLATPADTAVRVPAEAFAVLHVPSPKSLLARRETNDYVALAFDVAAVGAISTLLEEVGNIEGDGPVLDVARMVAILGDCDDLLVYAEAPRTEAGAPDTVVLAARGAEHLGAFLRSAVGGDARAFEFEGVDAAVSGEAGLPEVYLRRGDLHVLASAPTVESAAAAAARYLAAEAQSAPAGPLALAGPSALRSPGAALEFAIDLRPIWRVAVPKAEDPFEAWLTDSVRSMEWVFGSYALGTGEDTDFEVVAPFAKGSALARMLEHLRPVDHSLFDVVPRGALRASALSIDLAGLVDWFRRDVAEVSPELARQVEAGLDAANEALGLDVTKDLFGNLSHTVVTWECAGVPSEDPLLGLAPAIGVAARIADPEPFLDLMDTLQGLAAGFGELTTTTLDIVNGEEEIEFWSLAFDPLELSVGVGAGALLFTSLPLDDVGAWADGLSPRAADAEPRATSLVADPVLARALAAAEGTVGGLTVQRADAIGDVLISLRDLLDTFAAQAFDVDSFARSSAALDTLSALVDQYLDGAYVATLEVVEGRLVVRARTR